MKENTIPAYLQRRLQILQLLELHEQLQSKLQQQQQTTDAE